jgi:hypothetical protein
MDDHPSKEPYRLSIKFHSTRLILMGTGGIIRKAKEEEDKWEGTIKT